jgi:hypothetical protein
MTFRFLVQNLLFKLNERDKEVEALLAQVKADKVSRFIIESF